MKNFILIFGFIYLVSLAILLALWWYVSSKTTLYGILMLEKVTLKASEFLFNSRMFPSTLGAVAFKF